MSLYTGGNFVLAGPMNNLLLSLTAAVAGLILGAQFGSWTTGIVPAIILFIAAWIILMRRISKKVEAIMILAGKEFEAGRVEAGKKLVESARPLGRWQFLLEEQIDGQLGSVEYMQRNYKAARKILERAGSRNWQSVGMLAAMDIRTGAKDKAVIRMAEVKRAGKKDPTMWGVLTYACVQAGDTNLALKSVTEGLGHKDLANSAPLLALQTAIQNGKGKKFKWAKAFGQPWLMFFPEQASNKMLQGQMYAGSRKTHPMPRR
jgi:hypothetical protein